MPDPSDPNGPARQRTLRQLMRDVPEGEEAFLILFGLSDPGHEPSAGDRTAAIVGASFLEHGLRGAIKQYLRVGLTAAQEKELFEDHNDSPLGSFSSRIRLAHGLGILDARQRKDFDTIRNVRNAFAHTMTHIEFTTPEIKAMCDNLDAQHFGNSALAASLTPKQKFAISVGAYYWGLYIYEAPGRVRERVDHVGLFRPPHEQILSSLDVTPE